MSAKPVHLYDEQFDGYLHAACYTLDADPGDPRIVCEDDFEATPKARRCRKCARIWWPHGCEPEARPALS
jgi:hypothetical protein